MLMLLEIIRERITKTPLTCSIHIIRDFNIDLCIKINKDNNSQQLIQTMSKHYFNPYKPKGFGQNTNVL